MKLFNLHPVSKYLNKENYDDDENKEDDINITVIIFIIFAVLAFYLSWTCNTVRKEPVIIKIIYGLFAAIFNWLYIFLYFIFRHPCLECKN